MEWVRTGVRTVVEFNIHSEDILPQGTSLKMMREGAMGHRARQALLAGGWQIEVPLELQIPVVDEEWGLLLSGRMDAFLDGEVPVVEEMKLCPGQHTPREPFPAHRAQAVCYGHILCQQRGLREVQIRVTYISAAGTVRTEFTERLSENECRNEFLRLFYPYVERLKTIRTHEHIRNATLRDLRFPYPEYRAGQHEMAAQVYTAIRLGRRLIASMPTGTGKSSAALFPALKALGQGLTGRIYYLTAKTTQRSGPRDMLARLRTQPLNLWMLTLDAKERQCPQQTLCHPDWCPRAKGHFVRDQKAIRILLEEQDWTPARIRELAEYYCLCPFELSLSLAQLADVTICDYNYALDPSVHIQRIFDKTNDVTLLIDEAHHLTERVRDMLSGQVDGGGLRKLRLQVGKQLGQKHRLYQAMTGVLRALEDLPVAEDKEEGTLVHLPQSLERSILNLADEWAETEGFRVKSDDRADLAEPMHELVRFARVLRGDTSSYAWLWHGRKNKTVQALALDTGGYFNQTTAGMRGVICFSATMQPLQAMKRLLGADEEDACFAMPSPFPKENLLVLQRDIDTRYLHREASCRPIAETIEKFAAAHPGRYLIFFPSFTMLQMVEEKLELPHQTQTSDMTLTEREAFLAPYKAAEQPVLSLCVLGGIFSEGIDLPGKCLDGVCIVGVGLPQINLVQETLKTWYQEKLGDGFQFAYRLPGMQKVAQAAGRVIRTETDRGIVLLLDYRYRQNAYRRLLPEQWDIHWQGDLILLETFWHEETCAES